MTSSSSNFLKKGLFIWIVYEFFCEIWFIPTLTFNLVENTENWVFRPTVVKCVDECCEGRQRSRSCVWTNLWYVNNTFYAVGTYDDRIRNGWASESEYVVLSNPRRPGTLWDSVHPLFRPVQMSFANKEDFRKWVSEMMATVFFQLIDDGIVLPITRGAGYNFGHGILDELFPLFYSALKVGAVNQYTEPTTSFTPLIMASSLQANPGERPEQWIRAICGRDIQFENQWPPHSTALISILVSGHGHMGLSGISNTYTSPTGPEVDAMRMFRDRAYRGLGLTPPLRLFQPRDRFSGLSASLLQIGIFKNKRDFITSDAISALSDSSLIISGRRVQLTYIDFTNMEPKNQLEAIGKLDIVYTAPGTAICSGFLLPDGAIIILAGTYEKGSFSYMEEFFVRGLYYTRTFYTGTVRINSTLAVFSLLQAYNKITTDFTTVIPIPPFINSSPIGMILEAYFASDPMLWMSLVGAYHFTDSPNVDCLGWGERAVCGKSYLHCYPINQTRMTSLRELYNWTCRA
jgi:hypothetical protein